MARPSTSSMMMGYRASMLQSIGQGIRLPPNLRTYWGHSVVFTVIPPQWRPDLHSKIGLKDTGPVAIIEFSGSDQHLHNDFFGVIGIVKTLFLRGQCLVFFDGILDVLGQKKSTPVSSAAARRTIKSSDGFAPFSIALRCLLVHSQESANSS